MLGLPWRRKQAAERPARIDELTGLANRRALLDALTGAWVKSLDGAGIGALALLDVDRFKEFNDARGHVVGDELLRQLSLRLRHELPSSVVLARMGGDEFAVLFPRHSVAEAMALMADLVELNAAQPLQVHGSAHVVRFGVGLTDLRADSVDRVLARADRAVYAAKTTRDGRCVLFDGSDEVLPTRGELHAHVAELAAERSRLEHVASTDQLTGLPNRRALDEALDRLDDAGHDGLDYALLFLDLDRFGAYNHLHGDLAGDVALTRVAQTLLESCRQGETAFRKGGEELVVVLTGCGMTEALEVAERLRRAVEDLALPHAGVADTPIMTVTVGVAGGHAGRSSRELLDDAAKAAFAAKERQERNRVVLAPR